MKKVVKILSLFLIIFVFTASVQAKGVTKFGDEVVQKGEYDSTRFVAGDEVTNKASIDGLSFVAGNKVVLEGTSTYGFYAGNEITVREHVLKDMFVAGNYITIDSDAIIERDVYVAGNKIVIKTNIARNLRAGGDVVDLSGITIKGDAYVYSSKIILDEKSQIIGKLTYSDETEIVGLSKAKIGSTKITKSKYVTIEEVTITDRILELLSSSISGFLVMLCLFYLVPKIKDSLDKASYSVGDIAKSIGLGIIILIILPILVLIGLFVKYLMPLSLIVLAIYVISIYLSNLLVSYIVGKIVNEKVFKLESWYLYLAIGILIMKIIKLVPVIGGMIGALSLFYGMGLIYHFFKNKE